jgi:peptidyl-tRNA hydrolase
MYILVKASLPSHKVIAVAHGVLMCHLKFQEQPAYQTWLKESFRKVVVEVTDAEFETAKQTTDHVVVTESGLEGMECALVFCPRDGALWPPAFKAFPFMKI